MVVVSYASQLHCALGSGAYHLTSSIDCMGEYLLPLELPVACQHAGTGLTKLSSGFFIIRIYPPVETNDARHE